MVDGTWFLGGKVNTAGYVVKAPPNPQVTVSGGQTKILVLSGQNFVVQQATGQITGKVTDPSGNGLVARVWAETKAASGAASQTIADAISSSTGSYSELVIFLARRLQMADETIAYIPISYGCVFGEYMV